MKKPGFPLIFILILLNWCSFYAQDGNKVHPIEQVEATVSQFPIVKGSGDPGYTGDLNVDIPLLKVPGRNGLDYDLNLKYICGNGVPAQESASWVGLGWNLTQYQITCNPNYYTAVDSRSTDISINYTNRVENQSTDLYYLSYPGGSTPIKMFGDNNWYPLKWSGIKIDAVPISNEAKPFDGVPYIFSDYKMFIVTDVDGTRYIYSQRLKKSTNKKLVNHCEKTCNHQYHAYYYVFKLTAILAPDYVDGGGDPLVPNDFSTPDKGNWIKLDYSPTEIHSIDKVSTLFTEVNYLREITTPTHKAIFNLSTDDENISIYGGNIIPFSSEKILSNIQLLSKNGTLLKTVTFHGTAQFNWMVTQPPATAGNPTTYALDNSNLRYGLNSISIKGTDEAIPSYTFAYNDNAPNSSLDTRDYGPDPWGLLTTQRRNRIPRNENVAWTAWMLKSITYPTGGKEEFEYESDRYQPSFYSYRGASNDGIIAGGLRLKSRQVTDPLTGGTSLYQYNYALLNPKKPGYGFLNAEPFAYVWDGLSTVLSNDISQDMDTEVHYPDVQIKNPDGSMIRRYYTCSYSNTETDCYADQNDYMSSKYDSYINCYKNITTKPDPYVDDQSTVIDGFGLYNSFNFYNDGIRYTEENYLSNKDTKIYRTEIKEFDDEILSRYCCDKNDDNYTIKLFNNSWKRGLLTKEEFYGGPNDPSYGPPIGAVPYKYTDYFYTLQPIKSELYKIRIGQGFIGQECKPKEYICVATSGWAKLTRKSTSELTGIGSQEEYTYNNDNGLVEQKTKAGITNFYTYAYKSNSDMASRHMLSQKEFTVVGSNNSTFSGNLAGNLNINSLTRQTYSNNLSGDENQWYPDNTYQWIDKVNNGILNSNFDSGEEVCIQDNTSYDTYGNLLESKDANGVFYSTRWGNNSSLPVAGFNNASLKETSFLDFEDGSTGDWELLSNIGTIEQPGHTGRNSFYIPYGDYSGLKRTFMKSDLNTDSKYIFSAWVLSPFSEPRITFAVQFENGTYIFPSEVYAAEGGGDWEKLELVLDLPSLKSSYGANISFVEVYFENGDPGRGASAECMWDDIRFYPIGSLILSNTYDPYTYQLTSQSDANSIPAYFEYDGLQRLIRTKNYAGSVLSLNSYFYSRFSNTSGEFNPSSPNYISQSKYFNSSLVQTQKQYFDGLGRVVQTQVTNGNEDIISNITYDNMGRIFQKYKPYQNSVGHIYDPNVYKNACDYYNFNVYDGSQGKFNDAYPYSQTEYCFDGKPWYFRPEGNEWHNNHFIEYQYKGESLSTTPLNLKKRYNENCSDHDDSSPYCDVTYEYYDLMGNLIQKTEDQYGLNLSTKYSYDVLGRLTKTIPPNGDAFSTNYTYNTLGQLTQKSSPDAGTEQYFYDNNGNLRFIKDANHQSTGVNSVSVYSHVYDDMVPDTRTLTLVNKGKINFNLNMTGGEIYGGSITFQLKEQNSGVVLYTLIANSGNPSPVGSLVLPKGTYICTVQSNAMTDYAPDFSITCTKNLDFIYNKYDKLNRLVETGEYETGTLVDFNQTNAENMNFPPSSGSLVSKRLVYDTPSTDVVASGQRNLKGRLSQAVSLRNGNEVNNTFYSYDGMGRVAWTVQKDLGWYQKKLTYSYDLAGNVIRKGFIDYDWRSGSFYTFYTYDQAGRLSTVLTGKDSTITAATIPEAKYDYFASGKIKRLQLGNAQGMDYRYNERDWLTMINHQNLDMLGPDGKPQDPGSDGHGSGLPGDKYGMIIDYNRTSNHIASAQGVMPQWNGNISWVMYRMGDVAYSGPEGSSPLIGYTYSYDKANRLTKADFGYYTSEWKSTQAFDEQGYTYDANGNILTLSRYGKDGQMMDNLKYNYNPGRNQLNYIYDSAPHILNAPDLDNQAQDNYTYDYNGNVTSDKKNGIGFITYTIDNLPDMVYRTDGGQVYSAYDVNGNRVRKLYQKGSTSSDNFYVNAPDGKTEVVSLVPYGYQFTYNIWGGDNIGQVKILNGTPTRYYYLKDHLGNIRMTVNSSGAVDSYTDYYPFGGIMDGRSYRSGSDGRYKFTSKERDSETGLDYFGARYYDPRIGMWLNVDPMADMFAEVSPYNYCLNNPLRYIDFWGLNPDASGEIVKDDSGNRYYLYDPGVVIHGYVYWDLALERSSGDDNTRSNYIEAQNRNNKNSDLDKIGLTVTGLSTSIQPVQEMSEELVSKGLKLGVGAETLAKSSKIMIRGLAGVSATMALVKVLQSKGTGADYARFVSSELIILSGFIPGAGLPISLTLTIMDANGCFDGIYESVGSMGASN